MHRKLIAHSLLIASLGLPVALHAENIVVIVSKDAAVGNLTDTDVKNIFLGKVKSFPGGGKVVPIDQDADQSSFNTFYRDVIQKTDQQLQAYWSQQVFTGKGEPPKKSGTSADIAKLVATNPNMIGYVDQVPGDGSVKVVYQK